MSALAASGFASIEDVRLQQSPRAAELALSGQLDEREEARISLGLSPSIEPDKSGKIPGTTACGHCGRSDPPGGLTYDHGNHAPLTVVTPGAHGIPEVTTVPRHPVAEPHAGGLHCKDEESCFAEHDRRKPDWIDRQFPSWREHWQRVLAARQRYATYAAYHPAAARQLGLTEEKRFELALTAVRESVDTRLHEYAKLVELLLAAQAPEPDPVSAFGSAYDQGPPASWAMLPPCPDRCDHMTLRCPRARSYTHGHLRTLTGVNSAADAIARKAVA